MLSSAVDHADFCSMRNCKVLLHGSVRFQLYYRHNLLLNSCNIFMYFPMLSSAVTYGYAFSHA